nr:type II toxin-antitoxin system RelE/ParE family toxin [Accumulibacter sp.]
MVRLTAAAEADCAAILRWTAGQFGEAQARISARTVAAALTDLAAGPAVTRVTRRDDIVQGVLHAARRPLRPQGASLRDVPRRACAGPRADRGSAHPSGRHGSAASPASERRKSRRQ